MRKYVALGYRFFFCFHRKQKKLWISPKLIKTDLIRGDLRILTTVMKKKTKNYKTGDVSWSLDMGSARRLDET